MISAETLAQRQPVHAIIGPDLRVLQLGRSLARLCADAAGRPFGSLFELLRPTLAVLDVATLRGLGPAFCQVKFLPNGLPLRAEFLPGDDGCVVMIGSPGWSAPRSFASMGSASTTSPSPIPRWISSWRSPRSAPRSTNSTR